MKTAVVVDNVVHVFDGRPRMDGPNMVFSNAGMINISKYSVARIFDTDEELNQFLDEFDGGADIPVHPPASALKGIFEPKPPEAPITTEGTGFQFGEVPASPPSETSEETIKRLMEESWVFEPVVPFEEDRSKAWWIISMGDGEAVLRMWCPLFQPAFNEPVLAYQEVIPPDIPIRIQQAFAKAQPSPFPSA